MARQQQTGGAMSLDNIPVNDPEDKEFVRTLKHTIVFSVMEHPSSPSPVRTILLIGPTQSGKTQMVQRLSDSLGIPALVLSMAAQSAENFVSTPSYVSVTSSGRAQTMTQMGPPPVVQEVIRLQETIAQAAESSGGNVGAFRQVIGEALNKERQERGFISDPLLRVAGMSDDALTQLIRFTSHINTDLHNLPSGWKFAPVIVFVDEANKNPDLLPSLLTLSRDARMGHHKLAHIAIVYAMTEGGSNYLQQYYSNEALPDFLSRVYTYRIAASLPKTLETIRGALPSLLQQFQAQAQALTRSLADTPLASEEEGIPLLRGAPPSPQMLMKMAEAAIKARLAISSTWTDTNYETPTNWWRVLSPDSLALYHHIAQKGMLGGVPEAQTIQAIASEVQARLVTGHEHAGRIAEAVAKAMYDAQQVINIDKFILSDPALLRIQTTNLRETKTAPWALSENYTEEIKRAIVKFGAKDAPKEHREALIDFLQAFGEYLKGINDKMPKTVPLAVRQILPHVEISGVISELGSVLLTKIHPDVRRVVGMIDMETNRPNTPSDDRAPSDAELEWAQSFRSQRNPFDYVALYPAVVGGKQTNANS